MNRLRRIDISRRLAYNGARLVCGSTPGAWMNRRNILLAITAGSCAFLLFLTIVFSGAMFSNPAGNTATNRTFTASLPRRADGSPIPVSPMNLIGKSPAQVADYTINLAKAGGQIHSGTPQVRLVRPVTHQEVHALGLNCVADPGVIEEPPYVLVILQGDLQVQTHNDRTFVHYISYVLDVWAGGAAQMEWSTDDTHFQRALSGPPTDQEIARAAAQCPTFTGPRTQHYGEIAPTSIPPTLGSQPARTPPALPLPSPLATTSRHPR